MMEDRPSSPIIEDLLGTEIHQELLALESSIKIQQSNYEDIMQMHDEFDNRGVEYWEKNDIQSEITDNYYKYLHNYVASVFTVINHTQRIVNKYGGEDFYDHYTGELLHRGLDELGAFLQQLRHYSQKRRVPPLEVAMEFEPPEVDIELRVQKGRLLEWDGWNASGRSYLENLEENRPISEVYKDYQNESNGFYDWFFDYARLYFENELETMLESVLLADTFKESMKDVSERTEMKPTLFGYREEKVVQFPAIPPEFVHPYNPENILWSQ